MTMVPGTSVIVAEAVEPETDVGVLVAWDTGSGSVIAELSDERQTGYRSLGTTPDGGVVYSTGSGGLAVWDVESDDAEDLDLRMSGDWMRAVTPLLDDGTLIGVTRDSDELFGLSATGEVTSLGNAGGYTTSLALDESAGRIFWLAEAHGDAWVSGAPVMSLDLSTGDVTEVVRLKDSFESGLGLLPGGTYSMVYDRGRLVIGVNASPLDEDSGFGTVVLVVVEGL
jgi:hypothetical protein